MRVSRYSDYSLRVLMYAALRGPELATIGGVAEDFGISRNHLVKIVHALGQAGYLATRRGVGGGFELALPPEKIGLGAVIRLTETNDTMVECDDSPGFPCRIFPTCILKGAFEEAGAAFYAVLDQYSLADLVKPKLELKACLQI